MTRSVDAVFLLTHSRLVVLQPHPLCRSFDTSTGEALWSISDAHPGGVTCLTLAPNYKFLVSGGQNGEVRVWEVRSRELVCHLKEHTLRVNSVLIFDDNLHVLSCSRDRSFLCWDLQQEKRVSSHIQRMGGLNCMALSQDQQIVITSGQEKRVTYWELKAANPIKSVNPAHNGEATCMSVRCSGTPLSGITFLCVVCCVL
jgi:WD40 repeat protein